MKEAVLNDDDLKHLQQMTTRLQMMVYIALVNYSSNRTVNLAEAISHVQEVTHYSPLVIQDVYEKLELDDHIRPGKQEGYFEIGGTRKWKRLYRFSS